MCKNWNSIEHDAKFTSSWCKIKHYVKEYVILHQELVNFTLCSSEFYFLHINLGKITWIKVIFNLPLFNFFFTVKYMLQNDRLSSINFFRKLNWCERKDFYNFKKNKFFIKIEILIIFFSKLNTCNMVNFFHNINSFGFFGSSFE